MTSGATTTAPHAQPDAQLHAQLPGTAESDQQMPIEPNPADLAVVLRVLDRAAISQDRLSRDLNISEGHMSRYLSGKSPLPFVVVRYLWDRTGDAELLDLLGGRDSKLRLAVMPRCKVPVGVGIDAALPSALSQLAEAAQLSRGGQPRAVVERLTNVLYLLNGAFDTEFERALAPGQAKPNIQLLGYLVPVSQGKPLATA